ncbi:hypothetical protein BaRGS_00008166, partial [Batillaria attramentaria]
MPSRLQFQAWLRRIEACLLTKTTQLQRTWLLAGRRMFDEPRLAKLRSVDHQTLSSVHRAFPVISVFPCRDPARPATVSLPSLC